MDVAYQMVITPLVQTVLMYPMVITLKTIVEPVMLIVLMTVYRIVSVRGMAALKMMNAVYAVVITAHVQTVLVCHMVMRTKIIVALVTATPQMIVFRIVRACGVATLKMMNVIFVVVIPVPVRMSAAYQW